MNALLAIAILLFFTAMPGLESRASIPLAFFREDIRLALGLLPALAICIVCNIMLGIATFWLLAPAIKVVRRWKWFDKKVWPKLERTQHRLHPYVERYGELGLALFIGVPLPGTGAYAGALGAFLLGMRKRHFLIANLLGVLIACSILIALCLLLDQGLVGRESLLRRLFIKTL